MGQAERPTCPCCGAFLILALPPGGNGRRTFQCFECDRPDPLKTGDAIGWLKGNYTHRRNAARYCIGGARGSRSKEPAKRSASNKWGLMPTARASLCNETRIRQRALNQRVGGAPELGSHRSVSPSWLGC